MPLKPRSANPTMHDVARLAGVSQSCVSMVLNDAQGARIPEATRQRVLRAASTLNYSLPRRGPRGTTSSGAAAIEKRSIAFITDEISISPHTVLQIDGARDAAWAQEFTVQTYVTRSHEALEAATVAAVLADHSVAGVIFANSFTRELTVSSELKALPTVLVNCYTKEPTFPTLLADDVRGGLAATEYLIRSGHSRIAMITGERWMNASADRLQGYRDALAAAELDFDSNLVRYGDWSVASGYRRTLSLMSRQPAPTAFYCASDLMAFGCLEALAELNVSVPDEVSVVGHNDIDLAAYMRPPLTSCRPPNYELGQRAVETVLDLVQGVEVQGASVQRLDSKLVLRSSVAPPPRVAASRGRSRATDGKSRTVTL
jgi:LacI family transcriptional regulator